MISSSEKDTSPKPEAPLEGGRPKDAQAFWSLVLNCILIVKRGGRTRKSSVLLVSAFFSTCFKNTPLVGIVVQSYVLDKLLLIVWAFIPNTSCN